MKNTILLTISITMLFTACSQSSTSLYSQDSGSMTSISLDKHDVLSPPSIGSASSGLYKEIIASIDSTHDGLSRVDLILDEVGYGLELYFEPMDWDNFDNETRIDIAKSSLVYALASTKEYTDRVTTYSGFTSDGKWIFFNDSSFHIVVMDSDGSNMHATNIWP